MHASQVVMFPGLGATYARMVDKYLAAHPQDRATVHEWSDRCQVTLGGELPSDPKGRERQLQLEIHALNLLWWRRMSPTPDVASAVVCGHSLGYYAALTAAGVVSEHASFDLINLAFEAGWQAYGDNVDPIFVVTATEDVDFDKALMGLPVEVLSENSPLQRVLFGPRESIQQVRARMGSRLLAASEIGTRVPFHAQAVRPVAEQVAAGIGRLGLRPGRLTRPLWSHISARPLAHGDDALALVASQLHSRVRWHQLVDALIQAGRFDFTEVGPNRILSQVVRWISPRLEVRFVDRLRRQGVEA